MKAVTLPRLQIVILAAGFSSRLGQPKPQARVRGRSLLRRTLQLVEGLSDRPVLVVVAPMSGRNRREARGLNVSFVVNRRRAEGLSSSIRRAILRARPCPALLFLPVDLVNLRRRDLSHLISRWRGAPRQLIARRLGVAGGTPLILPRWLYPRALRALGDQGLRDLVKSLPPQQRRLMSLRSAERDVDTPRDLQAARRRWR